MTTNLLLFILLFWPCVRSAQVIGRISEGKPLGNEVGTVIGLDFVFNIAYWIFYIVIICSAW